MADPLSTPQRRPSSARGQELTTPQRLAFVAEWATAAARGAKARLLRTWKVSKSTACDIWAKYSLQRDAGGTINLSRAKRGGRPSLRGAKWAGVLESLPPPKRTSLRRWAKAAGVDHATLWRWAKRMEVKRHRRFIKPALTAAHKSQRVAYIRCQVTDDDPRHPVYHDHFDVVHVDEKWFYLLADGQSILLAPGETPPKCPKVKHKSHIPKAMFVAVAARPQPQRAFDGKIGIFPCTEWVTAQRRSKNWAAGEEKEIDKPVTAEYYRELMQLKILPAIIEHMPWAGTRGRTLVIQHDGAKPHTGKGNTAHWPTMFAEQYPGRRIEVVVQPAQSPDLNVLDLGFFSSLQRKVDESDPDSLAALLTHVEECYWDYPTDTLERVWQLLFNVYNCILEEEGGNDYLLPHTGVRKRQRAGTLERRVRVKRGALTATAAT